MPEVCFPKNDYYLMLEHVLREQTTPDFTWEIFIIDWSIDDFLTRVFGLWVWGFGWLVVS